MGVKRGSKRLRRVISFRVRDKLDAEGFGGANVVHFSDFSKYFLRFINFLYRDVCLTHKKGRFDKKEVTRKREEPCSCRMSPIYDSKLAPSYRVSPFYFSELDRYQFDYTDLVYGLWIPQSHGSILRSRIGLVISLQTDLGHRLWMPWLYESISQSRIGPSPSLPSIFWLRIMYAAIVWVHFTIQNWTPTIVWVQFTFENWTQPNRNRPGFELYFVYSILQIYSIIKRAVVFWLSQLPTYQDFY